MAYKRILIWEVNWIGDVLFSTPMIRALKENFPGAHISVITAPRSKEVLETNPCVDDILLYDERGMSRGALEKLRFIARIRKGRYDIVFLLHRSASRAFMCLLGGVRNRVGYAIKKKNIFLTHKINAVPDKHHRIEYFLGLARKAGADTDSRMLEIYTDPADVSYVENILKTNHVDNHKLLVAVNPGGNWMPKRWRCRKYAALCDTLIKEFKAAVIMTGSQKDIDLYLAIQEMMTEKIVSVCGKTTLRQLAALYSKSSLVISGDSGPLHVARAAGAKVLALFGPTSPGVTGPYGEGEYSVIQKNTGCKIPCYETDCRDQSCMEAIKVEDVILEAKKILKI